MWSETNRIQDNCSVTLNIVSIKEEQCDLRTRHERQAFRRTNIITQLAIHLRRHIHHY